MNKISEWLKVYADYSDEPEREVASQYAEAIERLVVAAEALNEHNLYECPCIQMDGTWKEFSDSLAAFREEQT